MSKASNHRVIKGRRTIRSDDSGAARNALHAMYKADTVPGHGLVNKPTDRGEVDEQVGIIDVLDGNPQVPIPGRGVVRRDGLASDRHYMANPAFGENPRRLRGVNPAQPGEVSSCCHGERGCEPAAARRDKDARSEIEPALDDRVDVPPGSHVCSVCRGASALPATPPSRSAALGFVERPATGGQRLAPCGRASSKGGRMGGRHCRGPSWQKQRTKAVSEHTARLGLKGRQGPSHVADTRGRRQIAHVIDGIGPGRRSNL